MRFSLRQLLDRLLSARTRIVELADVRAKLVQCAREHRHRAPGPALDEDVAASVELHRLRQAIAAAIGRPASCATCAGGHPLPHGRWDGGFCCGGTTAAIFTEHEVASLWLAGTRPPALRLPRGDHAGCAFRGPNGCSLSPVDRPNACLGYICNELARELTTRGCLDEIERACARLKEAFALFASARSARLEEAHWASLLVEIETVREHGSRGPCVVHKRRGRR